MNRAVLLARCSQRVMGAAGLKAPWHFCLGMLGVSLLLLLLFFSLQSYLGAISDQVPPAEDPAKTHNKESPAAEVLWLILKREVDASKQAESTQRQWDSGGCIVDIGLTCQSTNLCWFLCFW